MNATDDAFLAEAKVRYRDANRANLEWILSRPVLRHHFLNTKLNPLTLTDYTAADGWRGPDYLYGWMAGRGLETLLSQAAFFAGHDPDLAGRLEAAAQRLYEGLAALHARHGACFFCYDGNDMPVIRDAAGDPVPQNTGTGFFTYSDAFALKGLIAAAARFDPSRLAACRARMADLIGAIEEGRFIMDEWSPLAGETAAAQKPEFGPRMILLGAAAMLRRIGLDQDAAFGDRFIDHVLAQHLDRPAGGNGGSGLLRDAVGGDTCNTGHAIEFVGFALEYLPDGAPGDLIARLEDLLVSSFRAGFHGTGICLSVAPSGEPLSPYYPWWSLPETIRAAALCHARTGNPDVLDVWRAADAAFFRHYRRAELPIDYQTRTSDGPVDFVPSTPDLDPGYHTGLSLLGAIAATA